MSGLFFYQYSPRCPTIRSYDVLCFVLTPQPVSDAFQPDAVNKQPDLTKVYGILHEGFPNLLSYPLWLTDTSHRCRHEISQVLTLSGQHHTDDFI